MKKDEKQIRILFIIRIILWIVALVPTVYWIWYSVKLTNDGIFDPTEYATLFRPVFYTCIIISVAAVSVGFWLYSKSKKLKIQLRS